MRIQQDSKLVMIGDSITDCDRARPVAEADGNDLGHGYVGLVDAWVRATLPQWRLRVVNMGISGNTVRDLRARWQTDVLDLAPDWVSVLIGINDVWRQFQNPLQPERHVLPSEYAATLDALVAETRPIVCGMVLMTPFFIEPDPREPMRARMDEYGRVVAELAARHDAILVDTQAAFDAVMAHVHPMTLALDRVHPGLTGHMILARAFLRALDLAI
jgi:lysophospholipase L1-like esterase